MTSTELVESSSPTSTPKQFQRTYSTFDRRTFAQLYVIYGNIELISKLTGWPVKTLYTWPKAEWWPGYYDEAKREFAELLEARLSRIVDKATEAILDRIENGDEVLTRDGDIVRIKVSARDLGLLVRDGIDKIRLLQNK